MKPQTLYKELSDYVILKNYFLGQKNELVNPVLHAVTIGVVALFSCTVLVTFQQIWKLLSSLVCPALCWYLGEVHLSSTIRRLFPR